MKKHLLFTCLAAVFPFLVWSQWSALPVLQGGGVYISRLSFPTEQNGFALAAYSFTGWERVYKTTDGGNSWDTIPMPFPLGTDILNIHFCHSDTGFIAWRNISNGGMRLSITHNSGLNWTDISPDTANLGTGTAGLFFSDSRKGHLGVGEKIYTTTNGGSSWSTRVLGANFNVNDMDFADADHGMVGGFDGTFNYKGILYRTSDGGMTWDSVLFDALNSVVYNISNPLPGKGYTFRTQFGSSLFVRSSNGFSQYDSINVTGLDTVAGEMLNGVDFHSNAYGFIVTSRGRILLSTDNGSTWSMDRAADSISLSDIEIIGNKAYAAGDYGRLFVRDIVNATSADAQGARLQLAPNPVRAGAELFIQMPLQTGDKHVQLMDMNGRILADWNLIPGDYSVVLPDAAPGMYLLNCAGVSRKLVIY